LTKNIKDGIIMLSQISDNHKGYNMGMQIWLRMVWIITC